MGAQYRDSLDFGGTRLDDDVEQVRSYFTMGGFLNMSGITPESLVGPQYAIARGIYYRQVGRGGQGFLNVPVYVGSSIEVGNVWNTRSDISSTAPRPMAACSSASIPC